MSLQTTTETELVDNSPKPSVLIDRIDIIDIIRGVALLGILILNIPYFSMEEYFYRTLESGHFKHQFLGTCGEYHII
jgi:uncharacterized membrane protein YeiB